jgi:hypothetical protein
MEKKKLNKAVVLVAVLAVLTVIAAAVHLTTRDQAVEGAVQVEAAGETVEVAYADMKMEAVTGTRVDGKGDEFAVEGQGILLREVLALAGVEDYTEVSVVADDSYAAAVTKEEADEDGKAYLLLEEDSLRLVVFGDQNSKRYVSNVVQIVVLE